MPGVRCSGSHHVFDLTPDPGYIALATSQKSLELLHKIENSLSSTQEHYFQVSSWSSFIHFSCSDVLQESFNKFLLPLIIDNLHALKEFQCHLSFNERLYRSLIGLTLRDTNKLLLPLSFFIILRLFCQIPPLFFTFRATM